MDRIVDNIIRIAPKIFDDYPVAFAYLYGSYAGGYAHKFSDLDICIYLDEDVPFEERLGLQMAIALQIDEELGERVDSDVRIMNDLPLVIKGEIITEGVLIHSRDEDLRVEVECAIRKLYFDFLPVIQRHHAEFVKSIVAG